MAATLILLPVVWDHYYVLLLLPLAVIYGSAERRFGRLALIGVVFLLFHRYWRLTLNTGYAPILSFGLAGVMAVWAAVIGHVSTLKDPGLGQHRKA